MNNKRFSFNRPVAAESSDEIFGVVHEKLQDADFLALVAPDNLHVSLLTDSMLKFNRIPRRFIPYYSAYDSCRLQFTTKDTLAWKPANIATSGIKAIKSSIIIRTERPAWLTKERNLVRKISGIQEDQLRFKNEDYRPHITIARFIGTVHDTAGFYECEERLIKSLATLGAVTLGPLCLQYKEHSWEFQGRQIPSTVESDADVITADI